MRIQRRRLDRRAYLAWPAAPKLHSATVDLDAPRISGDQTQEQPDRGGFAGTIKPKKRIDATFRHRQIQRLYSLATRVAFAQAVRPNGVVHSVSPVALSHGRAASWGR